MRSLVGVKGQVREEMEHEFNVDEMNLLDTEG